ncbi:MAG: hypothetical protein ACLQU3_13490 [Limisphaerales bacterium]
MNEVGANEPDRGHEIDQGGENSLQGVHLMVVVQANEPQRGQHQDADTRAEIAAVNGRGERVAFPMIGGVPKKSSAGKVFFAVLVKRVEQRLLPLMPP